MGAATTNKKELIDWIEQLEDQAMLQNLKMLKEDSEGKDWWDDISDAEKAGIDRGLADSKAGRTTPHQEVRKSYEEWL